MQRYFGSRFLIPKELIPDYYNYFYMEMDVEVLKEQCPVCTVPLGEDPDKAEESGEVGSSLTSNSEVVNESKRNVEVEG